MTAALQTPAGTPGMSQISLSSTTSKRSEPARTIPEPFADFNALILLLTGSPAIHLTENLSSSSDGKNVGTVIRDIKRDPKQKDDATQTRATPFRSDLARPLAPQVTLSQLVVATAEAEACVSVLPNEDNQSLGTAPDTSRTNIGGVFSSAQAGDQQVEGRSFTNTGAISPKTVQGGAATEAPLAFAAQLTEIFPSSSTAGGLAAPPGAKPGAEDLPANAEVLAAPQGSNDQKQKLLAKVSSTLPTFSAVPVQRSVKPVNERASSKGTPDCAGAAVLELKSFTREPQEAGYFPKGEAATGNPIKASDDARGAREPVAANKEKVPGSPIPLGSGRVAVGENDGNFSCLSRGVASEKYPPQTGSAAETRDSPKFESKSETNPNLRPPPAREILLRLPGSETGNVDLRISERAGKVQIAVRTPDVDLAKALRSDISDLVGRLERKGFDTQTWLPPDGTDVAASVAPARIGSDSQYGNSRHADTGSNSAGDPQQQRQRNRPRWLDEMEAKNPKQDFENEGETE